MMKSVFIISFLLSTLFHGVFLNKIGIADIGLWASQADYFLNSDSRQFDFLGAYGHPGGPIIIGTAFINVLSGFSYELSLLILMLVFTGLLISISCVICFYILRSHFIWIIVLLILSINPLYEYSTPPSNLASLLSVLLCLFTILLSRKELEIDNRYIVLWSVISGFLISTRLDVGLLISLVLLISFYKKINIDKFFLLILTITISFVILNPYMWYMPVDHIGDILYKIIYHYEFFEEVRLGFDYVISFSSIAIVGLMMSFWVIYLKMDFLPKKLIIALTILTFFLYLVFLSSRYQASRYFLPIILIWEVFLPMSFFVIMEKYYQGKNVFLRLLASIIVGIYLLLMFVHSILINTTFYD